MNRNTLVTGALLCALGATAQAQDNPDIDTLRRELAALKADYEQRIRALEQRLHTAERPSEPPTAAAAPPPPVPPLAKLAQRSFNPDISLILDGKLAQFAADPEAYALPGFQLGGEAGPGEEGFSAQHSELVLSANADDLFFGQLTTAIASHEGATEMELEEAFLETAALGAGLNLRAGRFFSALGYLNQQHAHAWDFADAPLVYRALFGNQLNDDGVQLSWLAPTDLYLTLGAEWLRGGDWPAAGDAHGGIGAGTLFAKLGGDAGISHSWQLGLSHWQADVLERSSSGEAHGHGGAGDVSFSGDSRITGLDLVWKWAPGGNMTRRYLKLQGEYFVRNEDGTVSLLHDPVELTRYDGEQRGWYAQAVYQFMPRWRIGLRYDWLNADNAGSDTAVLEEAGLLASGHDPSRYAAMFDYSRSEFSRIRLQYNRDHSQRDSEDQWYLQYILSLGAHGAHQY